MLEKTGMPGSAYDDAVKSAEALRPAGQLRLAAELMRRLNERFEQRAPRSLLELRGMGKDVWLGVSVSDYLTGERSSWTG
jgi:hypothetical protein